MESFLESEKEGTASSVPPPPLEVSVRTMSSDLTSLGFSGGGPPRPINVFVGEPEGSARASSGKKTIFFVAASVCGAIILFAIGYFALPIFLGGQHPAGSATSSAPGFSNTPLNVLVGGGAPTQAETTHQSFFKVAADATLPITIPAASTGNGFYAGAVQSVAREAPSSTSFFELSFNDGQGAPLSFDDFLGRIQAPVLDQPTISGNFEGDFTGFLYRSDAVLSPGYIAELLPGKTPLLLANTVRAMEHNVGAVRNLFLNDPGAPAPAWSDDQISGQPVRTLSFTNGKTISQFVYGWFYGKYLIVSTSRDGLLQALSYL